MSDGDDAPAPAAQRHADDDHHDDTRVHARDEGDSPEPDRKRARRTGFDQPAEEAPHDDAGQPHGEPVPPGAAEDMMRQAMEEARARMASMQQQPAGTPPNSRLETALPESVGDSQANQIVVFVPGDLCGKIIGKGGESINVLQARSMCQIKIQPTQEQVGPKRKITIIGSTPEIAQNGKQVLEEFVAMLEAQNPVPEGPGLEPGVESIHHQVPPSCVGRVIGKGGETIRRLQAQSGAHIQVNREKTAVEIRGSAASIEAARQLVDEIIREGQARDAASGIPPGGYGVPGMGQSHQQRVLPSQGQEGRIIGKGGATIQEIQQRTGARVQVERETASVKISGEPAAVEAAVREVETLIRQGLERSGGYAAAAPVYGGYGGAYGAPAAYAPGYGAPQAAYGAYGGQQAYSAAPAAAPYGGYAAQPAAGAQPYGQYAAAAPAPAAAAAPSGGSSVWKQMSAPDGNTYYYNTQTGASQWERPAGF